MGEEMNPASRNCGRCGRPLSRYNKDDYCGPCARADGRAADARADIVPPDDLGARLRAVRERRGLTLDALGGLCGVSGAYICMIETGKRSLDRYSMILNLANALRVPPSEFADGFGITPDIRVGARIAELRRERQLTQEGLAERVSDGLHIPGDLLGVGHRPWESDKSACTTPNALAGNGALPAPWPNAEASAQDDYLGQKDTTSPFSPDDVAELMTWINCTNTTDDAIEQMERASVYLAEVHSTISPEVVLSGVLQTHGQVQSYLRSGKQRLRQTRELLRIDSALLSHACLLLGDLGDDRKATEYGVAALVLAQEADVDQATAWSVRAKTARWRGRYVESAEFARHGFEIVKLSPTKVELAYREANAIALFGDSSRAQQALHIAQATADELPPDSGSGNSVWSFPVARQAIFALSVAIHTGDPNRALHAAAMAEAAWAGGEPKNPATLAQIQAGASIAYLMRDCLDESVHSIEPVLGLPQELRISTVIGYLRRLGSMLAQSRFSGNGSAIELAQQVKDFISSSSPAKGTP